MASNHPPSDNLFAQCRQGILKTTKAGIIPGGSCLVQTQTIEQDGQLFCSSNLFESELADHASILNAQPVEIKFIDRASNLYLYVVGKLRLAGEAGNKPIRFWVDVITSTAYCMKKSGGKINLLQPLNS